MERVTAIYQFLRRQAHFSLILISSYARKFVYVILLPYYA